MIVNKKENLPVNIFQVARRKIKFVSDLFLDRLIDVSLGNGIKRKNYYLINITGMYKPPMQSITKEIEDFGKFLKECDKRGYTHLMIIK